MELQLLGQRMAQRGIVVDDQYLAAGRHPPVPVCPFALSALPL
jgi:hypothetical protein